MSKALRIAAEGPQMIAETVTYPDAMSLMRSMADWHPFYAASEGVPCYREYLRTALCAAEGHGDRCECEFRRLRACFGALNVAVDGGGS
jgi:hypothetical protein